MRILVTGSADIGAKPMTWSANYLLTPRSATNVEVGAGTGTSARYEDNDPRNELG